MMSWESMDEVLESMDDVPGVYGLCSGNLCTMSAESMDVVQSVSGLCQGYPWTLSRLCIDSMEDV